MLKRVLINSYYLIILAVIISLAGAIALIIGSVFTATNVILTMFLERGFTIQASKAVSIEFIELIDFLFLGIVFYIFALGIYHLFIDSTLRLPQWLKVEDFGELKVILASVIMVMLIINFAGAVVAWDGQAGILQLGLSIALVIAAIALVFFIRKFSHFSSVASFNSNQEKTSD
jgi:uncharacterized membrane protein YqhA